MDEDTRAAIRKIAREEAQAAVSSLAGLVLETAREAKSKGVSRSGSPLFDTGDAILSAFAEALGEAPDKEPPA
jgi:hypothetical protein